MKRAILLAAVLAAGILIAVLVQASGGNGNPAVAHVDGKPITKKQLASVVDHFRLQAKAEGKPFPEEGSPRFRSLRNRLLGLLVYRSELKQAAARLGVKVTSLQILTRLRAAGATEPGEENRDRFQYDSVESQLLYEGIFEKVTRGVTGGAEAELAARRNEVMSRYVARLRRRAQVRYEPGYAPGP
jgi:hypothetical protein